MKKKLMAIALVAVTAAFGEIWTINVPDGETKYLQTEVEALIASKGHGFAGGDIIEKEGGGRLIGTNTWKTADIVFHSLRHFCATILSQRTDLKTVQAVMGHRSEDMSKHYSNHETEEKINNMRNVMQLTWNDIMSA